MADTSRVWDREHKVPLYAAAGVSEVWLVDLMAEEVEVSRRPEGGAYRDVRIVRPGDDLAPEAFDDVVFAVADLLPPAQEGA